MTDNEIRGRRCRFSLDVGPKAAAAAASLVKVVWSGGSGQALGESGEEKLRSALDQMQKNKSKQKNKNAVGAHG